MRAQVEREFLSCKREMVIIKEIDEFLFYYMRKITSVSRKVEINYCKM